MKVLSLCDGMSCGRIALEQVGIPVEKYYAAEIKDIAIKATKTNFPDTVHIGDVNKVSYKDGVLITEQGNYETDIDLVIFGSPCQSFSRAMTSDKRVGLADKERSGLFLECYRVLKMVQPRYFLMENVVMKREDAAYITRLLGVEPIRINSELVSAQLRDRLYWTNIPNVRVPLNQDIYVNDILDYGYCERSKARALLVSDSRPLTTPSKMIHRYWGKGFTTLVFESKDHYLKCREAYEQALNGKKSTAEFWDKHTCAVFDGVRYLNKYEKARLQTVPEHYVDCMSEAEASNLLGDGWTVAVIANIFQNIEVPVPVMSV